MQNILVVAAHSDDEALGCGGTIASLVAAGNNVHAAFLTDGVGSRADQTLELEAGRRRQAADAAGKILGISSAVHFDFPDNKLDSVPLLDVVQSVEQVINTIRPDVIYTHHADDLNIDHRICHQAVLTASRPQGGYAANAIYGFEVASSTEWAFSSPTFDPRHFVEITDHLEIKLKALAAYHEEMRPSPHPRSTTSIEALARWRGATVGCGAAEAFSVIRQIVRKI